MDKHLSQESGFLQQFAEGLARMGPEATLDFLAGTLLPRLRKANFVEVHPLVLASLINTVCAKILINTLSLPMNPVAVEFIEFAAEQQLLSPVYRAHFLPLLPESPHRSSRPKAPPTFDLKIPESYDGTRLAVPPGRPGSHSNNPPELEAIRVPIPGDSHPSSINDDPRSISRSKRSQSFHVAELERFRGNESRRSPSKRSPSKVSPNKRSPSKRSPSKRSPSKRSPSKRSPSKRSPSKRSPTKRSPSKRSPSRRSPSRRSPERSVDRSRKRPRSKLLVGGNGTRLHGYARPSLSQSDEELFSPPATGINGVLCRLLNFESKQEKSLNKNFGYALMELNGDFVWCDPNSEKYFEIKSKELSCRNFFEMLIPFSKVYLTQKFGDSLFSKCNVIGASVCFSYVIYSRNSMNKFLKCLKKIGVSSEDEFKLRLKRKDSEDAIYHQYLKALSTRATMILLQFTDTEVQKMVKEKHQSLNMTRSFAEALEKRPAGGRAGSGAGGVGEGYESRTGKMNEFLEGEVDGTPKSDEHGKTSEVRRGRGTPGVRSETANREASRDSHEPRMMIRQFVLLETRLSLNVPMFDYRKMSDDPKIKNFEQKIIKKITKGS